MARLSSTTNIAEAEGQLQEVQDTLKAWVEGLDASVVEVGDAAGEDLAQHMSIQVERDIGGPCMCAHSSQIP